MSPIGVVLFTLVFTAACILFGDYYTKLNLSYNTWLVITIISSLLMAANVIFETFFKKDSKE